MKERRKEVSTIPVGWGDLGGATRKRCAGDSTWGKYQKLKQMILKKKRRQTAKRGK